MMSPLLALLLSAFAVPQAPSIEVVRKAVQDEFADLFTLNAQRRNQNIKPGFVTGDFNGDGRTDVAVLISIQPEPVRRAVSTNPQLSFPRLTITKALGKGVTAAEAREARTSLKELLENFRDSILLLIIHDFQKPAPLAQRFALIDFANNGEIAMTASRNALRRGEAGDSPAIAPPQLRGEALLFLDQRGEGTAVYWDGVRYLWYPVSK